MCDDNLSSVIVEAMRRDPGIFDDLGCVDLIGDLAQQFGVDPQEVRDIVRELEQLK